MPSQTNRQPAADALHQAFLVNLIAEAEAQLYEDGADSEDSSESSSDDTSSSSSSSSSDDEPMPSMSEVHLDTIAELYSQ